MTKLLEKCDADYKDTSIKDALRSALRELLVSTTDYFFETENSLDLSVIQLAVAVNAMTAVAAAVVKTTAVMALKARFTAETMGKDILESSKHLASISSNLHRLA